MWSPGQLSPGQARTQGQASSVQSPGQLSASLPQRGATLNPHGRDVSGEKTKERHYLLSLMPVRKPEASFRDLLCFRQLSWLYFFFFVSLLGLTRGMWDLSSPSGIEPVPPAVKTRRPNHWTIREVLSLSLYFSYPLAFFSHEFRLLFFTSKFKSSALFHCERSNLCSLYNYM